MESFDPVPLFIALVMLYAYVMGAVAARARTSSPDESDDLFFVFLVPALNEERVIGKTLSSLLALSGQFLILVVDDASDDGTVRAIAPFLEEDRVRLLRRPPEQARRGKGASLNAGYSEIQRLGLAARYGPENVIVVVFDADARVDPAFLQAVAPYFRDPRTAGVQCAIRMYNAGRNLLTSWQHLEFVVWGELFSRAKDRLGSATLGGNGQCTRLSALASLGDEPWRPSLTEDLDLSLRLLVNGWRLRFCPSVAVWQEAVPGLRALVRQRSRWLQGHLAAWHHLPNLLRSRLPLHTRLDLAVFLVLPIVNAPVGLASVGSWGVFWLDLGFWGAPELLTWYLLCFGMVPLTAHAMGRARRERPDRVLVHAHLLMFYSYVWLLASVAAVWNIVLGRRAWVKTSRVATEGLLHPAREEAVT
jgi:1,2-diacylglycerol 3-beta-glucosyltransferase